MSIILKKKPVSPLVLETSPSTVDLQSTVDRITASAETQSETTSVVGRAVQQKDT